MALWAVSLRRTMSATAASEALLGWPASNGGAGRAQAQAEVLARLPVPRVNVGFVIFPDLTQLDFTGPFEVLSRLATPPSISASSATCQTSSPLTCAMSATSRPHSPTFRIARLPIFMRTTQ